MAVLAIPVLFQIGHDEVIFTFSKNKLLKVTNRYNYFIGPACILISPHMDPNVPAVTTANLRNNNRDVRAILTITQKTIIRTDMVHCASGSFAYIRIYIYITEPYPKYQLCFFSIFWRDLN